MSKHPLASLKQGIELGAWLGGFFLIAAIGGTRFFAQTTDTGVIISTIKDVSGNAVVNATVQIHSESTGITVAAAGTGTGNYTSPPLLPGAYTVTVQAPGFAREVSHLTVELNERAVLDFTLRVGSASQTVTVESAAPLLEPESSTVGAVQNEEAVANLPLNTRNFNQLISLASGVMPAQTQTGALAITAGRGVTANQVNGLDFRDNNYRVDGLDNSENHNGQGILLFPPVEAIQEFQVQTSVPNAEYGHGGAAIIVAYKSGGRDFHGDLFEFLRNSALDAKNYFDASGPIPPFHFNDYGLTVGGPILLPHYNKNRDKSFFFFSWEGERRSQPLTYVSTVPLAAFKQGNFSSAAQTIYDPLTTQTLPNESVVRTAFPGNVIPTNRINQAGLNLINLFPNPNLPGLVSNYSSAPAGTDTRDNFDLRIDQRFMAQDQGFIRLSRQNTTQYTPGSLPAPAIGNLLGYTIDYPLGQVAVGYTKILTPNLLNEARAGATRLNTLAFNGNYGKDISTQVGIPGVNTPSNPLTGGLTEIDLTGYATLGDSGFYPAIIADNNFQFNDAVTWVHRRHSFKFGGEALRRQENLYQGTHLHGDMSFGPIYTTNPSLPSGTGNSLADLLLGAPASGTIQYLPGTVGLRRTDYGLFAQDTWKVTSSLTLNVGLRWDLFWGWPDTEVNNRLSYFDPSLNGAFAVNTPQIPWRSGTSTMYANFGPRVGFTYAALKTTLIRGAYGLFYDPEPAVDTGFLNPPFVGSPAYINNQLDFSSAQTVSQGFTRPPGTTFPTVGAALTGLERHLALPTASQWNVGMEQSLPSQILMTLSYVGTRGMSLILEPNINQPAPGPGSASSREPYPLYNTIGFMEGEGSSNYNSLQVTAEKRLVHNVQFLATYTWSHALDYGSFLAAPQNVNNLHAEYGNSDFDLRNRFALSALWELPVGRGRMIGSSLPRAAALFVEGWKLSTITSLYSGLPFTVTSAVNTLNGSGAQRANRIGSGWLPPGQRSIAEWFKIADFQVPAPYQFGNSGRDILTGPGTKEVDLGVFKSFPLAADQVRRFEFRADFFNLLNTPQFDNPSSAVGAPGAGVISAAGSPVSFQRTSREIQVSGKIYF
jgi:hypothetical protein